MIRFRDLRRAVRHYPGHRHNQVAWLKAVAYLRERGIWILEQPVVRKAA